MIARALRFTGTLLAAAVSLHATDEPATARGTIVVQACWSGPPGGKVHLVTQPARIPLPLTAQSNAVVANTAIPPCAGFELWVANAPQARRVAEFKFPTEGRRFILVLKGEHPASMQAWLVPADLETFPWGSATLLNLSDRPLRGRLDAQEAIVAPGKSGVIPLFPTERMTAHLALDYQDGAKWVPDCSTKTILTPAKRFILVAGPGLAAQGPLPKDTVVETNPAPLTGPTPLPHPPAK
jgi:hypothetical protein